MLTSAQIASERLAASGDPKVAQALPRLERALNRAIVLASNVLAFGKSEEPAPQKIAVSLRSALEAAAEDAGLASDGVRLESAIDSRALIQADPEQLHRILVNLLRNAREAIEGESSREGAGRVSATIETEGGVDRLRLADDGPGLPERARAHLFQPFSSSSRKGGAGLGLAIARELAQAQGGDLALVSAGPEGTVFELSLPAAHQAPLQSTQAP
jgi:signal transduction histidine kinase